MDEEELLGFNVFVAELELLVSKHRVQTEGSFSLEYSGALVEVLQKLVVSLDHTNIEALKSCQGRCEQVLNGVLFKGACPEVRQLICKCLAKMYKHSEALPIYSEVNALQEYLMSKDGQHRRTPESCRLGALDCLTQLCLVRGQGMFSSLPSFVSLATRHAGKGGSSTPLRVSAIQLAATTVRALGPNSKSGQLVQEEALRLAERNWKLGSPEAIRVACFGIISSIARVGGGVFWQQGGGNFVEVVKVCVTGLGDHSQAISSACGEALGELAASVRGTSAQNALQQEMRVSRRTTLDKVLSQGLQRCIVRPFVEAAVFSKKDTCIALGRAWVAYIDALSYHCELEENDTVELAMQMMSTLAAASGAYNEAKTKGLLEDKAELGFGMSSGELPVAQASVLYAFRIGIIRRLSETGQRVLADKLIILLASIVGGAVAVAIGGLAGVQVLLEVLGEIPGDISNSFEQAVMEKLISGSSAVRSQAAGTLGSIARANPGCVAQLVSTLTDYLRVSADQLASLSAPFGASHPLPWSLIPGSPGSPSLGGKKPDESTNIKMTMHAMYGHSLGLAAVLIASRYSPLGVPSQLYSNAFTLAKDLILSQQSPVANARAVRLKSGHCVLGALCIGFPEVLLKADENLLVLWEQAFGDLAKDVMMDKGYFRQKRDVDLAMQFWWRASALESLRGYIQGILLQKKISDWKLQLEKIVAMLSPMVYALSQLPNFQDPAQAPGGPGSWVAGTVGYLQLRLLEVYSLVPTGVGYPKDHEALVKLCSKPIRGPTALLSSSDIGQLLCQVMLQPMLASEDRPLGASLLEQSPLDEQLRMISGQKGAPQIHPWEGGMGAWGVEMTVGKNKISSDMSSVQSAFPQHKNLGLSLLEMQLKILGHLLWRVASKKKIHLLELLITACKKSQGSRDSSKTQAIVACVCCAALSCFSGVKHCPVPNQSDSFGQKLMELAYMILDCCNGDHAVRRAAGELVGYAALVGSDAFAVRCTSKICIEIQSAIGAHHRSSLAFGMGCIFRTKGGMSMQSNIPEVVDALFSSMRRPTADIHFWAFHGLLLVANAGGLAYLPHVNKSLQLAQELMLSNLEVERLRPFVGRMTNAMVAVLGPELTPEGDNFRICKTLMRLMDPGKADQSLIEVGLATSAALELVLYAQQLVLFAPQAVPAERHLPILMDALLSPHPTLRHAAATTLRQIVERSAEALGKSDLEIPLFAALDSENESHIVSALQATLSALMTAQCPSDPQRWIAVCSSIVLGLSKEDFLKKSSDKEANLMRDGDSMLGDRDDEHKLNDRITHAHAHSRSGSVLANSVATPRIKTKLFACQCLLEVLDAVGDAPEHFDLIKAADTGGDRWLIMNLEDLVKLGFTLATGQVEALRPCGVQLLDKIILAFSAAEDPDVEGANLLFQYQAQFVSPLRLALASNAPPLLFMHGATLAVSFLKSGLAGGDMAVLKQLMALLVSPLTEWHTLQYLDCSEWVGAQVRVALLEAHAHCSILAQEVNDVVCKETVRTAQNPILLDLQALWFGVLMDYSILSRWQSKVWDSYSPAVITINTQSDSEMDMCTLHGAWPVILQALSKNLPPAQDITATVHKDLSLHSPSAVDKDGKFEAKQEFVGVDGMADVSVSTGSNAASTGDRADQGDISRVSSGSKEDCEETCSAQVAETPVGPEDDLQVEDRRDSCSQSGPSPNMEAASEIGSPSRHLAAINTRLTSSKDASNGSPADLYWQFLDITTAQLGTTAMRAIELFRSDESSPGDLNVSAMLVCIEALQKMLTGQYLELEVCPVSICIEALEMLISILQQVVHPLLSSMIGQGSPGLINVVSSSALLVKNMCSSVSASAFNTPTFVRTVMDLILCCTSILSSENIQDSTPEDAACRPVGLISALDAARITVQKATWDMVSGWVGMVLLQGLHIASGEHTKEVYLAVKECAIVCCTHAWNSADSQSTETSDNSKPHELVLSVGTSIVKEVALQLEDTQLQKAEAFYPRCLTLLSTLFELTFFTAHSQNGNSSVPEFHNNILALLISSLEPTRPTVVHSVVLESLRELVQKYGTLDDEMTAARQNWCIACLVKVGPLAACAVKERLVESADQLVGRELQVVVESFKLFFLSVNMVEARGPDSQIAVLNILIPLLIEAVDPPNPTPVLIDVVLKLINRLSVGPASVPFRQVVASLPVNSKVRLQQALKKTSPKLQEESTKYSGHPGTFTSIGNVAKSSIVLKTQFGLAKPT